MNANAPGPVSLGSITRASLPLLACALAAGLATTAPARTLQVPSSQYPTIQSAVDAAQTGDIVAVAPGTYSDLHPVGGQDTTRCVVTMKSGITLRGAGQSATIVNPRGRGRGIHCSGVSNAVIEDLQVQQAVAPSYGAGILCTGHCDSTLVIRHCDLERNGEYLQGTEWIITSNGSGIICLQGSSPRIQSCYIYANRAPTGAGIRIEDSSLRLLDCRIEWNESTGTVPDSTGGGVYCSGAGITLQIQDCFINYNYSHQNHACCGGGLLCQGTFDAPVHVSLSRTTFVANSTYGQQGGGISLRCCSGQIVQCSLVGNYLTNDIVFGGGLYVETCTGLAVSYCLFGGNHVTGVAPYGWGSAIYVGGGSGVRFYHCTISDSSADYLPSTAAIDSWSPDPSFDHCILAFNREAVTSCHEGAGSCLVTCSDVYGNGSNTICGVGSDNVSLNPLFCDHDAGLDSDYRLASGSPCLPGSSCQGDNSGMGSEGQGCTAAGVGQDPQLPAAPAFAGRQNPQKPPTAIEYTLPRDGSLRVRVLDVTGRTLRTLEEGPQTAGAHRLTWDGRDQDGRTVPNGAYFYLLEEAGARATQRLILIR